MATVTATLTHFTIDLPFLKSEWENLNRLGEYSKLEDNFYRWMFPLAKLKDVEVALNGTLIQFDKEHLLKTVIPHCDPLVKELEIEVEGKGKGEIALIVDDLAYHVHWVTRGTKMHYTVAKALIEKYWFEAMADLPKGKSIEKKALMNRFMKSLEKHHWDIPIFVEDGEQKEYRERVEQGWKYGSGNFNYKYLQGDRAHDIKLWYAPIKVMVGLGLVEHKFSGKVVKLVDNEEFENQRKFGEQKLYSEQVQKEIEAEEKELDKKERGDILKWAEKMR